jgi:hypothetical protein
VSERISAAAFTCADADSASPRSRETRAAGAAPGEVADGGGTIRSQHSL